VEPPRTFPHESLGELRGVAAFDRDLLPHALAETDGATLEDVDRWDHLERVVFA